MTTPPPFRGRRADLRGSLGAQPWRRWWRWRPVRVAGESMRPTLLPGDLLLVRLGVAPRAGDVVVAELPGGRGPGVKRAVRREPEGWWLERDSRLAGTDSWLFGAVPAADVVGVVRVRLWPRPGRLPPAPR